MAILFVMAYLIDVTGILLRKQELQTMAELGAAAGGRVVAEKITELADEHVRRGDILPPEDDDAKNHPERFLTPEERLSIQTDSNMIAAVRLAAENIAGQNRPQGIAARDARVEVIYPSPRVNDCAEASRKTLDIKVEVAYDRPFILGKLATEAGAGGTLQVKEAGLYRVTLCP